MSSLLVVHTERKPIPEQPHFSPHLLIIPSFPSAKRPSSAFASESISTTPDQRRPSLRRGCKRKYSTVQAGRDTMAKQSRTKAAKATNWEWVDESNDVVESVKAPHDLSSFNFVAENGLSRPRGEKPRKLIRAHATRHGRANQSSSGSTSSKLPSLTQRVPRSTSLDPFRTLPGGEAPETSLLLNYYTQFPMFEPFKPLPGAPTPQTNPVLGDWIAVQEDPGLEVGQTAVWLSFSKAEPSLFHATLLIAGIRMMSDAKSPAVQVALLHQRGEAIRGVCRYLQNHQGGRDDVSWTIICAVAALAQADSALALKSSCLEHLNGLELLIRARGGIETLKGIWNGRARSYIEWIDLNASLVLGTPPRFSSTTVDIKPIKIQHEISSRIIPSISSSTSSSIPSSISSSVSSSSSSNDSPTTPSSTSP